MAVDEPISSSGWSEQNSQAFIDWGRYFVPDRQRQMDTICALIPPRDEPFHVLELCCGAGLLARTVLDRYPLATVYGYDGSPEMLAHASAGLARFGERFVPRRFDLAAIDWRQPAFPVHAVVSSLAIHHLDGDEKQTLFGDVYRMLQPGGVFVIADLIEPALPQGLVVAAEAWDEAVRERALELDGTLDGVRYFEQERWNLFRYPDPTLDKPSRLFDQLQWLAEAGFVDADVVWLRAGHAIYGGRRA